jgi:hypothetical protein
MFRISRVPKISLSIFLSKSDCTLRKRAFAKGSIRKTDRDNDEH